MRRRTGDWSFQRPVLYRLLLPNARIISSALRISLGKLFYDYHSCAAVSAAVVRDRVRSAASASLRSVFSSGPIAAATASAAPVARSTGSTGFLVSAAVDISAAAVVSGKVEVSSRRGPPVSSDGPVRRRSPAVAGRVGSK